MNNKSINKLSGWISLYRSLLKNDLWLSEKFTKGQAWIDLLLLANRKDNLFSIRGVEIKLKKGQLAYSIVSLSKRWQWNERTVSNFLKSLNRREMIHSKTNNISTVITICNYEEYQKTTEQSTEQNTEQMQSKLQTNNNRDKGNKNSYEKISSLKDPKIEHEIRQEYHVSKSDFLTVLENLENYCQANGRKYKDYKAALHQFIRTDISKGKIVPMSKLEIEMELASQKPLPKGALEFIKNGV